MEPDGPHILAVTMLKGSADALSDPSSVLLSASTAKALFGNTDPIGKTLTIDIKMTASVRGVYKDLPDNSHFSELHFIGAFCPIRSSTISLSMKNMVKNSPRRNASAASPLPSPCSRSLSAGWASSAWPPIWPNGEQKKSVSGKCSAPLSSRSGSCCQKNLSSWWDYPSSSPCPPRIMSCISGCSVTHTTPAFPGGSLQQQRLPSCP